MLPVEHLHLKHVLQTVSALESVVLRSFGPEGGQVLFTRDTGQAMLTRSGTRILTALRLEHPVARMVVDCVRKHSKATGDGSKTFLLLLASLLRMIHAAAWKEPAVSRTYSSREAAEAATARRLADELLAFALEELDDVISAGVLPYGLWVSWEDLTAKTPPPAHTSNSTCVQKLLVSFFHTRLGQTHSDFISDLTCELLRNCRLKRDLLPSALQFVNDNFPALHTPVSGFPISCSHLIEGQVIHRDFAVSFAHTDHQPVKAVVFTQQLQLKLHDEGVVLKVGSGGKMMENKSIVEFSAWSEKSLECVFAKLQCLGVSVLLSAVKQSAAVLALAAQAHMCVVECISEDELSLFAQLSGTTPVSHCWRIEPVNVAFLTFCRPILLGVHRYVHVAFHDLEERTMVKPCSVVVCGPGEGQTDQYACAFQDAIRMLLTTCKPTDVTVTTVLSDRRTRLHTDDHSDQTMPTSFQQCVLETGCALPAGGTFECLLSHALLQHGRRCSVSHILANALLNVPRLIYSQSPRHFLHIQTRILSFILNQSHTFSPLCKQGSATDLGHSAGAGAGDVPPVDSKLSLTCCRETGVSLKAVMLNSGLDSLGCKYRLLLAVLQCVSSLLRVDTMLYTHTALNTQSCSRASVSWEGSEDEAEH
ncbi:Bardet-Biedl syndrome 10 protein [Solea senegalensis]|uniref:Bardet-Biedl syndrome 10 protein n=1 Tax=Solea senegalensis TaxID=28829 RepID=A0AAV6T0R9_SOLSE|nr:Bardet-Biedl syndrome 10 protein [Solea senegalensis]KAG7522985.1 Bardet-Biedl syndrome 10 protein [Solea senegalensis]